MSLEHRAKKWAPVFRNSDATTNSAALPATPPRIGRLAVQVGLAFALAMGVAGGIAFLAARYQLMQEADEALAHESRKLILKGYPNDSATLAQRVIARRAQKILASRGHIVYAPDGRLLADGLDIPPLPDGYAETIYRDHSRKWHQGRALSLRLPDGGHLVIVEHSEVDATMREMMLIGLIALIVVGGLAGVTAAWVLTRQIAQRLDLSVGAADAIAQGDLSRRISLDGLDGIFATQAGSLNHMLDRMEQMVRSQRHFASHLAHDLRTPLTRLRGLLQAEADAATTDRPLLDKAERECRSIIAIFDALLRLSEIEAGRRPTAMAPLALDEAILDVAETMEPVIADAGSQLALAPLPPATVLADAGLVQQLLVNLLDNIALHTPAGTQASVALAVERHEATITIADNGPGILPPERERVVRPYESGKPTPRRDNSMGSGLGLAIAQAIMRFHNGALELVDNRPGLMVRLRFPVSN
ncbi:sensor histidine kinase [Novosphingobium rosa]|uniref:sensor histidine kinase n=1 Tax=Novosphingobium rosa TaxID=76978 RepID=UPI0008299193|nr:HAMP domain-containing sensor histidine kinase [Novosphingobium rosa]